jgi:hypothetical protein
MARQCGDCSLCCKILGIPELEKPRNEWCPHVILKRGCQIYDKRPASCQNFHCLWLLDERLGDEWKPNKSKMVVTAETNFHIVIYVDKSVKQPWLQEPYITTLREMSAKGIAAGGMVTVVENGETIVVLPDQNVRVEKKHSDDRIVMKKVWGKDGPSIEVRVVRADQVSQYGSVGVGWTKPSS